MASYWLLWRKCKICGAVSGDPCRSLSGRIVKGRPDGLSVPLDRVHRSRTPRMVNGRPVAGHLA